LRKQHRRLGTIRVIGGKWRGRKITFQSHATLRPTPDRVRETLFNWLASSIQGGKCLDLFAGSGILGFEALSRGSSTVTAVEEHPKSCQSMLQAKEELYANLTVVQADVKRWLEKSNNELFNVVFLDPPYHSNLWLESIQKLQSNRLVVQNGFVYVETNVLLKNEQFPIGCELYRMKKAGNVYSYLIRIRS